MSTQTAFERATKRLRALGREVKQDDFDRSARELYQKASLHGIPGRQGRAACFEPLSLADRLKGRCPACGGIIILIDVTPEDAKQMLIELKMRRRELGLNVEE